MPELLPTATSTLLDLFQGPLKDVRFPDADAKRLATAVDAVKRANAALALAEAELLAAKEVLASETERTLAYARVYAADRPDLRAVLDAKPPRRARRKKGEDALVAAAE